MKTNYEIIETKDYQGDKCYKINYVEYGTLYTMPEPHYTKKAATEKLREMKAQSKAGAALGSIRTDKKAASSRINGKLGGRPKLEKYSIEWKEKKRVWIQDYINSEGEKRWKIHYIQYNTEYAEQGEFFTRYEADEFLKKAKNNGEYDSILKAAK